MDTGVECWTTGHLLWATGIGLPMFLLWVIGLPVAAFVMLTLN